MQDTKLQTATKIFSALSALEQSIETTMLLQARLQEALLIARLEEGLAFTAGHGIIARVATAGGRMAEVRGDIVEAHKLLDSLAKLQGYPEMAEGDKGDGPARISNVETQPVRVVA